MEMPTLVRRRAPQLHKDALVVAPDEDVDDKVVFTPFIDVATTLRTRRCGRTMHG
jgi:hypothetical protein